MRVPYILDKMMWNIELLFRKRHLHPNPKVRKRVLNKTSDMIIIRYMAEMDSDKTIRMAALKKIDDKSIYKKIILSGGKDEYRIAAMQFVDDIEALYQVSVNKDDRDLDVRREAARKIFNIEWYSRYIKISQNLINLIRAKNY